jgi:hypothetical protein
LKKRKKAIDRKESKDRYKVTVIRLCNFAIPHENVGWFQVSNSDFNKHIIPFVIKDAINPLTKEMTDTPVVFRTELGDFIVATLGGLTAICATFAQDEALRRGKAGNWDHSNSL